ncbi:MAG TPA: YetF domain-containing protein, partial [Neobacillus sp.]
MGSIVANAIIDKQFATLSAITTLILFAILTVFTGYLSLKNFTLRKLINSEPVTLVENGTIVDENMKKMKLTLNELKMKLREKDAFNVADVEFAIMETDGKLSVLPKSDKKPLTPYHMNIQTTSSGLEKDIIIDGTIMEENLTSAGLD